MPSEAEERACQTPCLSLWTAMNSSIIFYFEMTKDSSFVMFIKVTL